MGQRHIEVFQLFLVDRLAQLFKSCHLGFEHVLMMFRDNDAFFLQNLVNVECHMNPPFLNFSEMQVLLITDSLPLARLN